MAQLVKGIDTSEHQASKVDYNMAKQAGYDFAILRIGYNSRLDKCFEYDFKRAKDSGLKVGVYFYPTTLSNAGAKEDAKRVLNWLDGRSLDMPIVYDMEEKAMNTPTRKASNSAQYNAFASVINAAGYPSMLYTGEYMFNNCFNRSLITDPVWIAKYSSKSPQVGRQPELWQYTSRAMALDFYKSPLDRSYLYVDYDVLNGKHKPATQPQKTEPSNITRWDLGKTYTLCVDGLRVRKTPGTDGIPLTYKELSVNARKNAYPNGTLKISTKVTCKSLVQSGDTCWMLIPSGWICCNYKGKDYVK